MSIIAKILIGVVAAQHFFFLYFEMFAWTTKGPKIFTAFPKDLFPQTKEMAANQGLYNGFLAAGLVWSLLINNIQWAQNVGVFFCGCVVVAALYGGYSVDKKILFIQGIPATLAILAMLFL